MELEANRFPQAASRALQDKQLKAALDHNARLADATRVKSMNATTGAEALRQQGRGARLRGLARLPELLEHTEQQITARGGQVLWARDADEANRHVLDICERHDLKFGVKSKSMVTEELRLVPLLEQHGIHMLETDLGEFVVQIDKSRPSHIVAPIMHMKKERIHELFVEKLGMEAQEGEIDPQTMTRFARRHLRSKYFEADFGITGGNFIIAETGTVAITTNEGNARLGTALQPVHVAIVGIEKVIPTWEDYATLAQTLARSATGQQLSVYSTLYNGPALPEEGDGPQHYYLILVDNGRSAIYGSSYSEALACIRCGACLNTCPVYQNVGGHAYGAVYPGPIGSVITPLLTGPENATPLPFASSLCGACKAACPVDINIPDMLLELRHDLQQEQGPLWNLGMQAWSWSFSHPLLYETGRKVSAALSKAFAPQDGGHRNLPGPLGAWTEYRDFPSFPAESFRDWWRRERADQSAQDDAT